MRRTTLIPPEENKITKGIMNEKVKNKIKQTFPSPVLP